MSRLHITSGIRIVLFAILAAGAASLALIPVQAETKNTATETAVASTYVSSLRKDYDHSQLPELKTDTTWSRKAYVQFSVQPHYSYESASFKIYVTEGKTSGFTLYTTDEPFNASSVRYDRQPELGVKIASSGPVQSNSWVSIDVSKVVNKPGAYGFALIANGSAGSSNITFNSMNAGNNKPHLVINYGTAPISKHTSGDINSGGKTSTTNSSKKSHPSSASNSSTSTSNEPTPSYVVRAALYYPWYPSAWYQQGSVNRSSLGYYESSDTNIIKQHITQMQYAHLDAGAAAWWGPEDSREDSVIPKLLSTSKDTGFKWALYYMKSGFNKQSASEIKKDLDYIKKNYSSDPSYLTIKGKPVVFAYSEDNSTCGGYAKHWKEANASENFYIILNAFDGYRSCASSANAWSQYAPKHSEGHLSGYSFSISPGYHKLDSSGPVLARNLTSWKQAIKDMVASNEPLQFITTFNQWSEGSAVESASEWAKPSPYGSYINALHDAIPARGPGDSSAPVAPHGVQAVPITTTSVKVSWKPSTDNVGISRYSVFNGNALVAQVTGDKLSATDPTTRRGKSYSYRIVATDDSQNVSDFSSIATIKVPVQPKAPSNLSVAKATSGSVALKWKAAFSDLPIHVYNILRDNIVIGKTTSTSFTDKTVLPGKLYEYAVSATDEIFTGTPVSNIEKILVPKLKKGSSKQTGSSKIKDLKALVSSPSQVNLSWSKPSSKSIIDHFKIFRSEGGSVKDKLKKKLFELASVPSTTYSFGDVINPAHDVYTYVVKAFDVIGNLVDSSTTETPETKLPSVRPGSIKACGWKKNAPVTYKHVIWIWMENKNWNDVFGAKANAPYEKALMQNCGTNPLLSDAGKIYMSLPNYIAGTSGVDPITEFPHLPVFDCSYSRFICHAKETNNIYRQVRENGGTVKSFQEDMLINCQTADNGLYVVRHNPAVYFDDKEDRLACMKNNLPLGTTKKGNLHDALLRDESLPTFSFITPNLINDTHDAPVSAGDKWLSQWMPQIINSPVYKAGKTAIFLQWDEDTPMPNIMIAPSVKPGTVVRDAKMNHYSILRTTEQMLGINQYLGLAGTAPDMRDAFNF